MSNLEELAIMDATAQAELVHKKEVKPIELVEAAIERIERLNPELNAVVTPMYDLARDAATGEIPAGPFSGVPFLLKDILAECAGVRFTDGSAFSKDYISDHDSELVVRIKKAGLIICGKTNVPDWGSLPIEGGVQAAYRRDIEAADNPDARRRELEDMLEQYRSPFRTAEAFGVEEVIDPRDTRPLLCDWVALAYGILPTQLGPKSRSPRP